MPPVSRTIVAILLQSLFVGAVLLWLSWPLARDFPAATIVPTFVGEAGTEAEYLWGIGKFDQRLSLSNAWRNARAICEGNPGRLIDAPVCFPARKATTFGEHQIEGGILAAPFYLLGADPVTAFNLDWLLTAAIAAASMLLLVQHWTGNLAAAFVAGTAFALLPFRLMDTAHPAVVGIHWLPLVIYAFEKTLRRPGLAGVVLLAFATALQSLVGAYPLVILAVVAGCYGVGFLAANPASANPAGLLRVTAAVVVAALPILAVLLEYAATSARHLLQPNAKSWNTLELMAWGEPSAFGATAVLAALAAVLLARGERGPRRLPALALGFGVSLWMSVLQVNVFGLSVPGLAAVLAERFPLFDAIRGLTVLRSGAYACLSMAAGIGVARILARLPRALAPPLVALLALAPVAEIAWTPLADALYGRTLTYELLPARPEEEALAAYRSFEDAGLDGAIVEIPYFLPDRFEGHHPKTVFTSAWQGLPTTACYNSFMPPVLEYVTASAAAFPSHESLVELSASGMTNVVVRHATDAQRRSRRDALGEIAGLLPVYRGEDFSSWRIVVDGAPASDDAGMLRLRNPTSGATKVAANGARYLPLIVENGGDRTFAAAPDRTVAAEVAWESPGLEPTVERRLLALPPGLAAGRSVEVRLFLAEAPPASARLLRIVVPEMNVKLVALLARNRGSAAGGERRQRR